MAAEEKPKIFEGGKDMLLSLGVVVVMMLVTVGATGLCSVNPEQSQYARVNEVDASSFLDLESRATETPLRDPQMPEGWTPNSARRTMIGGENAAVVGWVTAAEGFVQSTQTPVPLADALKGFDGQFRPDEEVIDVDGLKVTIKTSTEQNVRQLWGADLGDARLLLTGSASREDFETAVRAFKVTAPLPN